MFIVNKNIQNNEFGLCAELIYKNYRCLVSLEYGPRIVYYGTTDENYLFSDTENSITKKRDDLKNLCKDNIWRIYGGHRIWKAPEDEYTYYPDNIECKLDIDKEGYVCISSPEEVDTKLIKTIKLKFSEDGYLNIINSIQRRNECKIAPWTITVLKPHGKIIIPLNEKDTGYLPNRSLNLWSYSSFNDKRLKINDKALIIDIEKEDKALKNPLKIGTYSELRKVYYLKSNKLIKFETLTENDLNFPDYNSNIEIYTINKMVEVEFLEPFKEGKEELILKERWKIYDKETEEYEKIKKFLEEKNAK